MKRNITLTMIEKLHPKPKEYHVWDKELHGFGVRVRATGNKTFIFKRRVNTKLISKTLGNVNKVPLIQAREMASYLLQELRGIEHVNGAIGSDIIAPICPTFANFVTDTFWPWALGKWKPSSLETSEVYLRAQLMPSFGKLQLDKISKGHIVAWFDRYSQTRPGGANRALDDLKVIFAKAVQWDFIPLSPIVEIRKNPKKKITRFLSRKEIRRLSEVLEDLEAESLLNVQPANIVRLLLLTGCRHQEITTLKWDYIVGNVVCLPDSKTGPREVYLSDEAVTILRQIRENPRYVPEDRRQWVFPGNKVGAYQLPIRYFWKQVCSRAGFVSTRIHDLRHTFASQAALQGHSLIAVKNMLGHKSLNMTMIYVHVADTEARQAATKIAKIINDIMANSNETKIKNPTRSDEYY